MYLLEYQLEKQLFNTASFLLTLHENKTLQPLQFNVLMSSDQFRTETAMGKSYFQAKMIKHLLIRCSPTQILSNNSVPKKFVLNGTINSTQSLQAISFFLCFSQLVRPRTSKPLSIDGMFLASLIKTLTVQYDQLALMGHSFGQFASISSVLKNV